MSDAAIFLDRDGVLIADVGLITQADQFEILEGVAQSLARLATAGYRLIVVSNQAVVARGLIDEPGIHALHRQLDEQLQRQGAAAIDEFYFCPHHPHADELAYRIDCDCRKPKPGMLLQAARKWRLDLPRSVLLGDRLTDILAGQRAGCRTVLVESSATSAVPIVTSEPLVDDVRPDFRCLGIAQATDWILRGTYPRAETPAP